MTASSADPHIFARHPQLSAIELRTARGSNVCYWTHTHEEYSIGIIDAGHALYSHGPHTERIRAGMTVLVSPGLVHACNPEPAQVWSYRMMYLQSPWVMQSLGLPTFGSTAQHPAPFTRALLQSPALYKRLDRICKGIALVANPLAIEEEIVSVLSILIHTPHLSAKDSDRITPALQKAKDRLSTNVEEVITLKSLAQMCEMDAFELIRKFKAAFGMSPYAYQLDQRINASKPLLKQGMSLAEVALRLGFADQAHFQRHFKQRHAISPKAYLKNTLDIQAK